MNTEHTELAKVEKGATAITRAFFRKLSLIKEKIREFPEGLYDGGSDLIEAEQCYSWAIHAEEMEDWTGAWKWADRAWYALAVARLKHDATPLLFEVLASHNEQLMNHLVNLQEEMKQFFANGETIRWEECHRAIRDQFYAIERATNKNRSFPQDKYILLHFERSDLQRLIPYATSVFVGVIFYQKNGKVLFINETGKYCHRCPGGGMEPIDHKNAWLQMATIEEFVKYLKATAVREAGEETKHAHNLDPSRLKFFAVSAHHDEKQGEDSEENRHLKVFLYYEVNEAETESFAFTTPHSPEPDETILSGTWVPIRLDPYGKMPIEMKISRAHFYAVRAFAKKRGWQEPAALNGSVAA